MNDEKCPLITLLVVSYNQQEYIREAVVSALAQDYSPLQIVFSDDASTDSTFSIIQEMVAAYTGDHQLVLNRNDTNLGVNRHINHVVNTMVSGELLVIQAGDDISEMNRVSEVVRVWRQTHASAIYCNATLIDSGGREIGDWILVSRDELQHVKHDPESNIFKEQRFYGAGAAYDVKIFKKYGPLPQDIRNEDYALAWRSSLDGGIAYHPGRLLRYRKHALNLSYWVKARSGASLGERLHGVRMMHKNLLLNKVSVHDNLLRKFFPDSRITIACQDSIVIDRFLLALLGEGRIHFALLDLIKISSFKSLLQLIKRMVILAESILKAIFIKPDSAE